MNYKSFLYTTIFIVTLLTYPAQAFAATELFHVTVTDDVYSYFIDSSAPNVEPNYASTSCGTAASLGFSYNLTNMKVQINNSNPGWSVPAIWSGQPCLNNDYFSETTQEIAYGSLITLNVTPPPGMACFFTTFAYPSGGINTDSNFGTCNPILTYNTPSYYDGATINARVTVKPAVTPISSFTVTPRDLKTTTIPGFNISWNDTQNETQYTLTVRNQATGAIYTKSLAANQTSTTVLDDPSEINKMCNGTNYIVQLEATDVFFDFYAGGPYVISKSLSPAIIANCNRNFPYPSINSAVNTTKQNLGTALINSFNTNVTVKSNPTLIPVSVPLYVPNASATNTVKIKLRRHIQIRYGNNPTANDILDTYDEFTIYANSVNTVFNDQVPWPGVRQKNERVRFDVSYTLAEPPTPTGIDISTVSTLAASPQANGFGIDYTSATDPTNATQTFPFDDLVPNTGKTERGITQIGKVNFSAFPNVSINVPGTLYAERPADVKVSLTGTENIPQNVSSDVEVVLSLDISGSMRSKDLTIGGTKYKRIEAAKEALRQFVNNAPDNFYVGLTAFATCFGNWDTATFPDILWSYEGKNSSHYNDYTGHAILLQDLAQLSTTVSGGTTQRQKLLNWINAIDVSGDLSNLCTGWDSGAATDYGGGITASLAAFKKQAYTGVDVTKPYTYSKAFNANPPRILNNTLPPNLPKYIVFASDGEQNTFPRSTDDDIDAGSDTPVKNAVDDNIPIITILMGQDTNGNILKNIAATTGGKFYSSKNGDELINAFENALGDISENASNTTLSYHLNTTAFDYTGYNSATGTFPNYKIYVRKAGESEANTGITCTTNSTSDCYVNIANGTTTIRLPFFKPEDRYYFYFQTIPKPVNTRTVVRVNSETTNSVVNFIGTSPADLYNVANTSVTLLPSIGFFLTEGGNTYSINGLVSYIGQGIQYFATQNEPILFTGPQTGTNGIPYQLDIGEAEKISPTEHKVENEKINYDFIVNNTHLANFNLSDLSNNNPDSNTIYNNDTEVFMYNNPSSGTPLAIPQPDAGNPLTKSKIIISPEDIYINNSIEVTEGKFLALITNKNILIDQSVSRLDAIVIADNSIYTYCTSSNTSSCGRQGSLGTGSKTITLNGMFIAQNGLNMGRSGDLGTIPVTPGEIFVMRPDFLMAAAPYLGIQRTQITELGF